MIITAKSNPKPNAHPYLPKFASEHKKYRIISYSKGEFSLKKTLIKRDGMDTITPTKAA